MSDRIIWRGQIVLEGRTGRGETSDFVSDRSCVPENDHGLVGLRLGLGQRFGRGCPRVSHPPVLQMEGSRFLRGRIRAPARRPEGGAVRRPRRTGPRVVGAKSLVDHPRQPRFRPATSPPVPPIRVRGVNAPGRWVMIDRRFCRSRGRFCMNRPDSDCPRHSSCWPRFRYHRSWRSGGPFR